MGKAVAIVTLMVLYGLFSPARGDMFITATGPAQHFWDVPASWSNLSGGSSTIPGAADRALVFHDISLGSAAAQAAELTLYDSQLLIPLGASLVVSGRLSIDDDSTVIVCGDITATGGGSDVQFNGEVLFCGDSAPDHVNYAGTALFEGPTLGPEHCIQWDGTSGTVECVDSTDVDCTPVECTRSCSHPAIKGDPRFFGFRGQMYDVDPVISAPTVYNLVSSADLVVNGEFYPLPSGAVVIQAIGARWGEHTLEMISDRDTAATTILLDGEVVTENVILKEVVTDAQGVSSETLCRFTPGSKPFVRLETPEFLFKFQVNTLAKLDINGALNARLASEPAGLWGVSAAPSYTTGAPDMPVHENNYEEYLVRDGLTGLAFPGARFHELRPEEVKTVNVRGGGAMSMDNVVPANSSIRSALDAEIEKASRK